MAKKSKKSVKQIPAKAGAKTTTKSGDKVEVVLKTTKVVKDRTRGKYKPRKKTNKKQDKKLKESESLALLRQQVELEKLRKQQEEQVRLLQPAQRFRNSRTGGDINQFFDRQSKSDGTKEVVSELQKEIKKLREDIKKKEEKSPAGEEPKPEEKSKFVQELETTQNEIQRQRIQRGIARRDEEQRRLANQRRIEEFEKKEQRERLRRERGIEAREKQRTARQQSQLVSDERFREQESLKRAKQIELQDLEKRRLEQNERTRERGKIALKKERQQRELQEAIVKENERREKEKLSKKQKELKEQKELFSKDRIPPEPPRAIKRTQKTQRTPTAKPQPIPEPEPTPQSLASSIVSNLQSTQSSDFNQPSNPIHRQRSIQQVSKDIRANLDNEPLLQRERQRQVAEQDKIERPPRRPVLKLKQEDDDDISFESADEFEDVIEVEPKDDKVPKEVVSDILSGAESKIDKKEKAIESISSQLTEQVLEEAVDELTQEERKERRRSFKKEAEEDEKKREEFDEARRTLKEDLNLQKEIQDKAKKEKDEELLKLQEDERKARDLLLQQSKKSIEQINEDKKIDDMMREIKERKKLQKKRARDNLRKKEQQELIDETLGEIVSEAVDESERSKLSKSVVDKALGSGLANEVLKATQQIPRDTTGRYSEAKRQEKAENLRFSDFTGSVGRKAYSEEDSLLIQDKRREAILLKDKIATLFPKYFKKSTFGNKMSLEKTKPIISDIMERVREDGELTGLQAVKFKKLLDELAKQIQDIINIENKYRFRGKFEKETEQERQQRIRREIRERQAGVFDEDTDDEPDLDEI